MATTEVLMVDDDPNVLRGLGRALRGQPFTLLTCRSAEEALAIVKARPIGVVVTDERMPGRSGTELLAWVARETPEIVRIVLTGHTTPETTMRAVNEGRVFRFFSKPCNPLDLALAIRDGLELHESAVTPEAAVASL
ncbi:MAG: response regulator [Planctomycetota bacterium]